MVRDAFAADFSEIQRIHAESDLDYQLPELESPLFFVRKVFCDRQGNILGACLLRLTAEAYLFLAPETGARKKMEIMQELQPAVLEAAWSKGIDEVECRIPETVEHRFMKRLLQLGWSRDRSDWWPWSRKTR